MAAARPPALPPAGAGQLVGSDRLRWAVWTTYRRLYEPWVALDFTAGPVDWAEVGELMESSYRLVALKRMLKALDARA